MKTFQHLILLCLSFLIILPKANTQNAVPEDPKVYVNPDWKTLEKELREANQSSAEELENLQKKYKQDDVPQEEQIPQEILDILQAFIDMYKKSQNMKVEEPQNQSDEMGAAEEELEAYLRYLEDLPWEMDEELTKLENKYDANITPEEEPVSPEVKKLLEAYQRLLEATLEIEDIQKNQLKVTPKGTGQTTGHIIDLTVTNNTPNPIYILPEYFYAPSDGRHQSYVGLIPEDQIIYPGATIAVPVKGYCADVHTPPVPLGGIMPPLESWIPVAGHPIDDLVGPPPMDPNLGPAPQVPEPMNPPGANDSEPTVPEPMNPPGAPAPQVPEPMNPPGANDSEPTVPEPMNPPGAHDSEPTVPEPMNPPGAPAPQVPEPMNPPGANDSEPTVPEPMNPPGGNAPPTEGVPVRILPRDPVPPFTPELIPEVTLTPADRPENSTIITYPGTDIPIDGTIDPKTNPSVYASILVEAVDKLEDAYEVIRESENFPTPYYADEEREGESVVQQVVWVYTAALSGDEYEQEDFTTKVYEQFETTTGKNVNTLPEEQKEQVDGGINYFWINFQATGVQAKVFSEDSPNLIDPDKILITVNIPRCDCENLSYDLEVKRGDVVVHTGSYTSDKNPSAKINNFKYGDVLDIKISNIEANCDCDGAECDFYPAQSTNSNSTGYTKPDTTRSGEVDIDMDNDGAGVIGSKGNNNCQNKDKEWNDDHTEFTFTLETRNERTTAKGVFQRLRIKSYCQLEDCGKKLCAEIIQLNFVTAK